MSRSNIYNNNIDSISVLLNELIVHQKDQKSQKDKNEEDLNTSFISEHSSIDSLLKRLENHTYLTPDDNTTEKRFYSLLEKMLLNGRYQGVKLLNENWVSFKKQNEFFSQQLKNTGGGIGLVDSGFSYSSPQAMLMLLMRLADSPTSTSDRALKAKISSMVS